MFLRLAADGVLILHLLFIVFVVAGGLLTSLWRWTPLIHLPCAAWGLFVELTGYPCPLTTLETRLRMQAGEHGYAGSFIEHYLLAIIYPAGLTATIQILLAVAVLMINLAIYGWLIRRRHRP